MYQAPKHAALYERMFGCPVLFNRPRIELRVEIRPLDRRVSDEQTSYRAILAEVRMRLAIEYLQKTAMTTEEIASRLGFSDASNSRQAFVR